MPGSGDIFKAPGVTPVYTRADDPWARRTLFLGKSLHLTTVITTPVLTGV
jgi:hypothetical protein